MYPASQVWAVTDYEVPVTISSAREGKAINNYAISLAAIVTVISPLSQAENMDCDNAMTTYQINMCSQQEVHTAEAEMHEYLNASKERYSKETQLLRLLAESQEQWREYRKVHCDAIYQAWAEGTIRGVMYNDCMLDVTKSRTHELWQSYLTYMDSTPPVLPEPK